MAELVVRRNFGESRESRTRRKGPQSKNEARGLVKSDREEKGKANPVCPRP